MRHFLKSYGRILSALFLSAVALWALVLIILPQVTMLERALTLPKRALDSSVALALSLDAQNCVSVLNTYSAPKDTARDTQGGMSVPSMGMAVPSMGNHGAATSQRPYILQCDRTNTHVPLVRDPNTPAWLDKTYGLRPNKVSDQDPIPVQIQSAREIETTAKALYATLKSRESMQAPYTLDNFSWLFAARQIPFSQDKMALENAKLSNKALNAIGLRYEQDGQIYQRIGMITLVRTLVFAMAATALALIVCYPIAYKVALSSGPKQAIWLFLGLIIPYSIVELMRIYAWTVILDNNGLINDFLMYIGMIADPIQFKRFPATVFVVIVYTYVLFMVFPIFNVMSTLDRNQIDAARDLGASVARVHWRIVIPHAKPGIAVGAIATFMLAAGAFSVPRIISRGLQSEWFSQTIYNKFFESENSNVGAAYSLAYTVTCFILVGLFMWLMRTRLKDFARVQ